MRCETIQKAMSRLWIVRLKRPINSLARSRKTAMAATTATESLTLQSYIQWRSLDLGMSAATADSLLVLVTVFAMVYVNVIRPRFAEASPR